MNPDFNSILGEKIRDMRKKLGINQQQLADSVGLSRVQICNIEVGKTSTTIETFCRICAVIQCKPNDILPDIGRAKIEVQITWEK